MQGTRNDTIKPTHYDSYVYIHSPRKGNIKGEAELRGTNPKRLEYGSKEYKEFKLLTPFPCCEPHGVFKNINGTEVLQELSGYLYFDVDNSKIPLDYKNDIVNYKEMIIEKYLDIISMIGKSIGGRGIFILIKVNGLTKDNFKSIHHERLVIKRTYSID